MLGRAGREVVPLGLGGIGSLAHPLPGQDAADIVVGAIELGLNYLDTPNVYGPSQRNYREAFRRLHLLPDDPAYDSKLRRNLYVASKTMLRYSFNPPPFTGFRPGPAAAGAGQGPRPSAGPPPGFDPKATAVDALERALTQLFGDGKG
ncbi:MAG: aldo/keto reductase [Bryobacterales bacterium]|nr:aldo/keto reductase [Bryobacterales bacterium]